MFEDSVKKNQKIKEEEEKRQQLYEQNRANMRERMRKIKEFLKKKKNQKVMRNFLKKIKNILSNIKLIIILN